MIGSFFLKNNDDFIRRNTHRPTEITKTNTNSTLTTPVAYRDYTVHQGYVRDHRADPTTLQYPRSLQTDHYLRYGIYLLTLNTRKNLTTDKGWFTRSSAPTAKPPTLERLAGNFSVASRKKLLRNKFQCCKLQQYVAQSRPELFFLRQIFST